MPTRRVRYSTLLWPELYSPLKIWLLAVCALSAMLCCTALTYLLTQPDQSVYDRAAERARAALQMKLTGVDEWRWRQNFACHNMPGDCLKLMLKFGAPEKNMRQHWVILSAPEACAICHSGLTRRRESVYAVFPSLPVKVPALWPALTVAAVLTLLFLWAARAFMARRRKAKLQGICVAALCISRESPPQLQRWFRRLNRSPFSASYAEREELRMRWITNPEKFARMLAAERHILQQYGGFLRLVAVHGDTARATALPVEMLRIVYRFLTMPGSPPVLVDEKLRAYKEEKLINMRRLVAKNKSGASLRFIIWESD